MQYPKDLLGVACALVLLTIGWPVAGEEATPSRTLLRPAKERGTMPRATSEIAQTETTSQRAMSLCIADWDAATHMTKAEWRKACERSVKDYPDAFR